MKYGVFIGRFQPLHEGHARVIETAMQHCQKLIVLIGSAGSARTLRNPWTWTERAQMIEARFPEYAGKFIFKPLEDKTYRDQEWITQVQEIVNDTIDDEGWVDKREITLVGSAKDHTGYYLNLFPNWQSLPVDHKIPLNSTEIRDALFGFARHDLAAWMSDKVLAQIVEHQNKQWYFDLRDEYAWVEKYKDQFKSLPYPPIFQTVDAAVIMSGNILLVERGKRPGKGKLAIPGGYLNANETIERATLRELREETQIDASDTRIRAGFLKRQLFDDVHRSARGRVLTHASLFRLPAERNLPRVKGSDDAARAFWLPLSYLQQHLMFEDHYHIIKTLVAGV